MRKTAIVILLAALLPGIASAQITGNAARDAAALKARLDAERARVTGGQGDQSSAASSSPLDKPFQELANFIGDNIDDAIALSTVIPNLQDGNGQQCLMAFKDFGEVIKAHPAPLTFRIAVDLEALRLKQMAINRLCASDACDKVFSDLTQTVTALSPIPLPVPNLHDLCSKVPNIKVVAPVTVPAAPVGPTPSGPAQSAPATNPNR